MMGTQASSHEDMLGTMNNTDDETDYTYVELNMMHFSASAIVEMLKRWDGLEPKMGLGQES